MVGTLMFCCTSGLLYFYPQATSPLSFPSFFCISAAINNDGQIAWAITTERPKCLDQEGVKTRSLLTLYF